jgi:hypothetical protein
MLNRSTRSNRSNGSSRSKYPNPCDSALKEALHIVAEDRVFLIIRQVWPFGQLCDRFENIAIAISDGKTYLSIDTLLRYFGTIDVGALSIAKFRGSGLTG